MVMVYTYLFLFDRTTNHCHYFIVTCSYGHRKQARVSESERVCVEGEEGGGGESLWVY